MQTCLIDLLTYYRILIDELRKLNVKSRYEDDEDSRDMDTMQSTSKGFIPDRYTFFILF
jgi:hypothetical protein